MVIVFARREIGSTHLLLPWMISPEANMFTETSVKQRACGWGLQRYRITLNSWRMRVKCAFFIDRVHLWHFVTLWATSFFHIFHKSHTSHLWHFYFHCLVNSFFSVLMHHLALSPASSSLLMLHYFSRFIAYFSYILAGQTSEIQVQQNSASFMLCSSALTLQSFFPICCISVVCIPLSFQLYTAGDKTRHNGQEAPIVSIMRFCVVA